MNSQKVLPVLARTLTGGMLLLCILSFFQTGTALANSTNPAFVRIIHASPDIGIVDAFVDGKKILASFQFGTVTDYVPLPTGSHTLQIALLGKGVNAALITQTLMVNEGIPYTIAALGTNATGFSLTVFNDNNFVAGNGAKVRVYHLSQATGAVNVDADAQTIVHGLSYPQASAYVAIPAGSYTFKFMNSAQSPAPFSTTLKPWTVTSVFAIGPTNSNRQIQFVSAQLTGMPGMPQTGSDPGPIAVRATVGHSLSPWLFGLPIVIVGALVRYRVMKHNLKKAL